MPAKAKPLPTQSRLRELLDYNPETGDLIWRARAHTPQWNGVFAGKVFGCVHPSGYRTGAVDRIWYSAHRLIWKLMTNEEPLEVDHIDGNRSNNTWRNLRAADRLSNARNRHSSKGRTAPYKGIWRQRDGKWAARIYVDWESRHLGVFATPEEAHKAYANASRQFHGEFGST